MAVLASAQISGCSRDRTTLQRTDACQMNATDVMLAETATAHGASMIDENMPDAPPSPSFDCSRVIEALAGSARTPHMLTIAAQLAAMLRARIGSGKLAPHRPIPGEPALLRQYGVAPEASRKAVRALVAEGLAFMMEGRGACVAPPRYPSTAATASN